MAGGWRPLSPDVDLSVWLFCLSLFTFQRASSPDQVILEVEQGGCHNAFYDTILESHTPSFLVHSIRSESRREDLGSTF